ncbi:hypothetical protein SBF1_920006 [Candidatus Desulfosporosinus infrequens]|uniref:Uncharacterized protein n=1 Tax=Candidatus Desulfosporosinus infrequens TaxID=2043169 RepID=A0A2U3LXK7_9FIRM|nr:hypothetical protein SBF1_920006 [Candidatus Desulfosporosinus infrequens]
MLKENTNIPLSNYARWALLKAWWVIISLELTSDGMTIRKNEGTGTLFCFLERNGIPVLAFPSWYGLVYKAVVYDIGKRYIYLSNRGFHKKMAFTRGGYHGTIRKST